MIFLIPFLVAGIVFFFVRPQIEKFQATLGINEIIEMRSFVRSIPLRLLGLKTPIFSTLAMVWSFLLTESSDLGSFTWDRFIPQKYAVWVSFILWALSLWAHFSGLNTVAAATPATTIAPTCQRLFK